jgi:hypothetical protein
VGVTTVTMTVRGLELLAARRLTVAMAMTDCVRFAVPVTCHLRSLTQTGLVFHVSPKNTKLCPRSRLPIARQKILSTLGHV